jgi:hypothetical protein
MITKTIMVVVVPSTAFRPSIREEDVMAHETALQGTEGTTRTRGGNGLAIAGFVCSLVGALFLWIILAPLGIIFGAIGLSKAKRGAPHRGLAIAAIVIGVLDIVAYVILTIAVVQDGGAFSGYLG